jgi:hypothetical protein
MLIISFPCILLETAFQVDTWNIQNARRPELDHSLGEMTPSASISTAMCGDKRAGCGWRRGALHPEPGEAHSATLPVGNRFQPSRLRERGRVPVTPTDSSRQILFHVKRRPRDAPPGNPSTDCGARLSADTLLPEPSADESPG